MAPRPKKDEVEQEYEVEDLKDGIGSSLGGRLNRLANELDPARRKLSRDRVLYGLRGGCSAGFVIYPENNGFEDIVHFLIQSGVKINPPDKLGNTPLLEAIKHGHNRVASLLVRQGASLDIEDAGRCLCEAVAKGDSDFLKRLLTYGANPNSKNYDQRTPLHVAAAEGLYLMAKMLVEAGASILSKDRWGRTPSDESCHCGSNILTQLLEEAKNSQLCQFPDRSQEN